MIFCTPPSMKPVSDTYEPLNSWNEGTLFLINNNCQLEVCLPWNFNLLNHKSDSLEIQIFLLLHLRLFKCDLNLNF